MPASTRLLVSKGRAPDPVTVPDTSTRPAGNPTGKRKRTTGGASESLKGAQPPALVAPAPPPPSPHFGEPRGLPSGSRGGPLPQGPPPPRRSCRRPLRSTRVSRSPRVSRGPRVSKVSRVSRGQRGQRGSRESRGPRGKAIATQALLPSRARSVLLLCTGTTEVAAEVGVADAAGGHRREAIASRPVRASAQLPHQPSSQTRCFRRAFGHHRFGSSLGKDRAGMGSGSGGGGWALESTFGRWTGGAPVCGSWPRPPMPRPPMPRPPPPRALLALARALRRPSTSPPPPRLRSKRSLTSRPCRPPTPPSEARLPPGPLRLRRLRRARRGTPWRGCRHGAKRPRWRPEKSAKSETKKGAGEG